MGLCMIVNSVATPSCATRVPRLPDAFTDEAPATRARAIIRVYESTDATYLSNLVDCLDDEDAAVRLLAILTLEKLTGKRLDYDYAAPRANRREAVKAWRNYMADHRVEPEKLNFNPLPSDSE